jgi:hypothetical protein
MPGREFPETTGLCIRDLSKQLACVSGIWMRKSSLNRGGTIWQAGDPGEAKSRWGSSRMPPWVGTAAAIIHGHQASDSSAFQYGFTPATCQDLGWGCIIGLSCAEASGFLDWADTAFLGSIACIWPLRDYLASDHVSHLTNPYNYTCSEEPWLIQLPPQEDIWRDASFILFGFWQKIKKF